MWQINKIILILMSVIVSLGVEGKQLKNTFIVKEQLNLEEETFENNLTVNKDNSPQIEKEEGELSYPQYEDWDAVTIQGKLKMQGLPLSPTLKIFMLKDSLINISIRAPFVGEAGRVVLTKDSLLGINKMNKTYVAENIRELVKYYPDGIRDIQNLLLARFFLPGVDIDEIDLDEIIDIYYTDNQYNVVPKGLAEIPGVKYGYVVDEEFNPQMMVVLPENRPDMEIDVLYTYASKGYDIRFMIINGGNIKEMTLELKNPEWEGEEPKPIDIDNKFTKLRFEDFLKYMGV